MSLLAFKDEACDLGHLSELLCTIQETVTLVQFLGKTLKKGQQQ